MYKPRIPWKRASPASYASTKEPSINGDLSLEDDHRGEFLDSIKSLFDVFDVEKKGYVTVDELEKYLSPDDDTEEDDQQSAPSKLINILRKICPASGLVNFRRFRLAIEIATGKSQFEPNRGLGRSLRPRSFLFAVTESSEGEISIDKAEIVQLQGDEENNTDMNVSSSDTTDEESKDLGNSSSSKDGPFQQLLVLQRCLAEAKKVTEIYTSRISELQKLLESRNIQNNIFDKELTEKPFDYSHVGFHIYNLWQMNAKLLQSQDEDQSNMEMKRLSSHIRQLEHKKSSLVKDLFGMKTRSTNDAREEDIPF